MELTMKRSFTLSSLLLTAATANTIKESSRPHTKPDKNAFLLIEEFLNEIGLISVTNLSGSQQDVEHAIARKADEQGASWYRIIQMYEEQQPDSWRVQAILYA
jgi:hypothetical protein